MTFDVKTATDAELTAKQRWYEARGTRFLDQIAEIRVEQERRIGLPPIDEVTLTVLPPGTAEELAAEVRLVENDGSPLKGTRSVVHPTYRARYAERGNKRGCGDWLHRLLDELFLVKGKLDVIGFEGFLTANSVKHEHWNRTTPGWQGRLRMSGRVALQTALKKVGHLVTNEGMKIAPQAGE